ncbi:MAG: MFS transporter, partial [Pseudomonadota bacterium]
MRLPLSSIRSREPDRHSPLSKTGARPYAKHMRLTLGFILTTVVIDAMGIGLILPVMPALLREIGDVPLSQAALWGGVLTTAFAVMQFFFSPIVGAISDRFGRRPVLLVSLLVMALDYLVMAVAQSFWLLLLARIVAGIAAATQSTATAAIADLSKPEEKAARFGLVGAAFGLGFVLGPMMGGIKWCARAILAQDAA